MNLFESSIQPIQTADNKIYLEAVTKMFNILFEETIGDSTGLSDDSIAPKDMVANNPRKVLDSFADSLLGKAKKLMEEDGTKEKVMRGYIGDNEFTESTTIDRLATIANPSTNDYDAWKLYKPTIVAIYNTFPQDADTANALMKNLQTFYGAKYDTMAKLLRSYMKEVERAAKWLKYFNKTTAPSFFTKPGAAGEDDKTIYVSDQFLNAEEKEPTANGKTKTAKPTKKEEQPKDKLAEINIEGARINLEDNTTRSLVLTGVSNVSGTLAEINQAIDAVQAAKPHVINKSAITVTPNDEEKSITIMVNPQLVSGSVSENSKKLTSYNVLLYCIYMYVRKHFRMDSTCQVSQLTAKSIKTDISLPGMPYLKGLFPLKGVDAKGADKNIDVLAQTSANHLSSAQIKSILTDSQLSEDEINNLVFAISVCLNGLGNSRLNNGLSIADMAKLIQEKKVDPDTQKTLANEKAEFNNQVANLAAKQQEDEEPEISEEEELLGLSGNPAPKPQEDPTEKYTKLVDKLNVYDNIVNLLNPTQAKPKQAEETDAEESAAETDNEEAAAETSDKPAGIARTGNYALDAARVIESCIELFGRDKSAKTRKEYTDHNLDVDTIFSNSMNDQTSNSATFDRDEEFDR